MQEKVYHCNSFLWSCVGCALALPFWKYVTFFHDMSLNNAHDIMMNPGNDMAILRLAYGLGTWQDNRFYCGFYIIQLARHETFYL